jgi:hypothetical protein
MRVTLGLTQTIWAEVILVSQTVDLGMMAVVVIGLN